MFHKLRTRIIVLIMALALLVSVALGVISSVGNYASARNQMEESLGQTSASYSLALENYLETLRQEVMTLAVSGGITSTALTEDQRQDNLTAVLRARPDLSGVYTIGTDGISINDSDFTFEDSNGEDYSEEAFFQTALATNGVWMDDPAYDEWTDNITLTVTYRYNDGAGFDGVVGMDVHYDVLLGIIQQGAIGRTGYSVLVAADGLIITHPDSSYVLNEVNYLEDADGEDSFAAALRQAVAPGDGLIENVTYQGEEVLLYTHTIAETGWTLVSIAKPIEFMDQFYATLRTTLLAVAGCLLAAVLMAVFIARSIARPVTEMTRRMQLFAEGDLHSPMPRVRGRDELSVLHRSLEASIQTLNGYVSDISLQLERISAGDITGDAQLEYAGDFAPIQGSLRSILAALNDTMGTVKAAAEQVRANSTQMAGAAQQLSDNTIQQAQTIDNLSVSFGEIKQGLEATAVGTTTALEKTDGARRALDQSRQSMDEMMQSMKQIDAAAGSIEKIIKTIDDIAFQTNILALNAAVEAARAGQHGKGFAVVADEVRSLAGKSAESAKQTAELIHSTLDAVGRGATTADTTWQQLNGLEGLVGEVAALVQQIEGGANQQAGAAGTIYAGLEQMNGTVQANSAMAEETASTSMEMDSHAGRLQQSLAFFSLRQGGAPALPPATRE